MPDRPNAFLFLIYGPVMVHQKNVWCVQETPEWKCYRLVRVLSWSERKQCFLTINFYRAPLSKSWSNLLCMGPGPWSNLLNGIHVLMTIIELLGCLSWAYWVAWHVCSMSWALSRKYVGLLRSLSESYLRSIMCVCWRDYISITIIQGRA